jgi:hypothetical protein
MKQTEAARKIKAKRARRPIYGTWARVVIPETGEERLAFLAAHEIDKRLLAERGMRMDLECRAFFEMSRNVKFHKLAHVIGHLLVDNVEEFRGKSAHDALKAVQLASNTACDMIEMDATPVISAILDACESLLGKGARKVLASVLPEIKTIPVKVARSIAFDEMQEDEFVEWFNGVVDWIGLHYASVMLDEVRDEFWKMVNGETK